MATTVVLSQVSPETSDDSSRGTFTDAYTFDLVGRTLSFESGDIAGASFVFAPSDEPSLRKSLDAIVPAPSEATSCEVGAEFLADLRSDAGHAEYVDKIAVCNKLTTLPPAAGIFDAWNDTTARMAAYLASSSYPPDGGTEIVTAATATVEVDRAAQPDSPDCSPPGAEHFVFDLQAKTLTYDACNGAGVDHDGGTSNPVSGVVHLSADAYATALVAVRAISMGRVDACIGDEAVESAVVQAMAGARHGYASCVRNGLDTATGIDEAINAFLSLTP